MKAARIQVLIGFFLTVSVIVTYRMISSEMVDADLKQAQIAYETEKVHLEREHLHRQYQLEAERYEIKRAALRREQDINFYGTLGIFSAVGLAVIILATGYSRAHVKQASVYVARIGQHSEIPIHQRDLQSFYPIAVNLSLAEIEASTSIAHEKAYRISRQMIEDITDYTRAIAGKRGMLALSDTRQSEEPGDIDIPLHSATPPFAELLRTGMAVSGKPIILGYDRQGQPQFRSLQDLKSLAVAGWQGSGKTLSTGYIVASSVLAYGVHAYIVDPHKHHPESLSSLLKPLEQSGHVTIINPFDTPALIEELDGILDRRLQGDAPSDPGIVLVIDEMARLAKMECFDILIRFLERCTEETRKANITFIGGSNKWTARHFKGRADIRGCMNSMLVHKMKPSQADLLLEDAQDKNLVKQLHRPGEAILSTDFAPPILVTIPWCTRDDMQTVAGLLTKSGQNASPSEPLVTLNAKTSSRTGAAASMMVGTGVTEEFEEKAGKSASLAQAHADDESDAPKALSEVIILEDHRHRKQQHLARQATPAAWRQLTVEDVQEQWRRVKTQYPKLTQAEVARQAGLSPTQFSRLIHGKTPLKTQHKQRLYAALFSKTRLKASAAQT
jgi:AraC-like DNA-binding protein